MPSSSSLSGFSRIIAGCWRLSHRDHNATRIETFIERAVDVGITSFDHADIYGDYMCEALFGQAFSRTSLRRDDIQLVTKCGIMLVSDRRPETRIKHYNLTREHILASVDTSLSNLQTDYLDLLLLHRPDPLMEADEIADAFDTLQTTGKVRAFGVSNFTVEQFDLIHSSVGLVTNQIELSPLQIEPLFDGIVDRMARESISPMAWSPFAGGKLFSDDSDRAVRLRGTLNDIATRYNARVDVLALAWLLRHPSGIHPVVGTGRTDRLQRYPEALKIDLAREDWFRILEASTGSPVP